MASGYIGQIRNGSEIYTIGSMLYGTCNSNESDQIKVVSGTSSLNFNGIDYLTTGITIHIKFINSNTKENPILQVGTTTAPIKKYGTFSAGTTVATSWAAGAIVSFTYDGTAWVMNTGIDTDTTYNFDTAIDAASSNAPTSKAVASYVQNQLENFSGGMQYIGTTSTEITNGSSTKPVINGETITPENGNIIIYKAEGANAGIEYIWDGTKWDEFGSASALKQLAFLDEAKGEYTPTGEVTVKFESKQVPVNITVAGYTSGSYTPTGTISSPDFEGIQMTSNGRCTPAGTVKIQQGSNKEIEVSYSTPNNNTKPATYTPSGEIDPPKITVETAGSTATVNNPTKINNVVQKLEIRESDPSVKGDVAYYSIDNETLILKPIFITTGKAIDAELLEVKTSDATYQSDAPTFKGTAARLTVPSLSATFEGTETQIEVTGTPRGSVSAPSFTGKTVQINGATAENIVTSVNSKATFEGEKAIITVGGNNNA